MTKHTQIHTLIYSTLGLKENSHSVYEHKREVGLSFYWAPRLELFASPTQGLI